MPLEILEELLGRPQLLGDVLHQDGANRLCGSRPIIAFKRKEKLSFGAKEPATVSLKCFLRSARKLRHSPTMKYMKAA